MTTKEQERKALAQIKKIVEGLGADSYVGTAFEGCFEIAEDNIQNDFACSMKQRCEANEKEAAAAEKKVAELQKELKEMKKRAEEAEALFNRKAEECSKWYAKYRDAQEEAKVEIANERKDVTITMKDKSIVSGQFEEIKYVNKGGLKFFTVVEKMTGWTTSYKLEDIETLVIR